MFLSMINFLDKTALLLEKDRTEFTEFSRFFFPLHNIRTAGSRSAKSRCEVQNQLPLELLSSRGRQEAK